MILHFICFILFELCIKRTLLKYKTLKKKGSLLRTINNIYIFLMYLGVTWKIIDEGTTVFSFSLELASEHILFPLVRPLVTKVLAWL